MSTSRVRHLPRVAFGVVLGTVGLLASLALQRDDSQRGRPRSVLEVLPQGATFLVSMDLRALRQAGLPHGTELAGAELGTLPRVCGFDPLDQTDALGIFAQVGATGPLDVGVAALGPFEASAMIQCAEKLIAARGGESRRTPIGTFTSVRDARGRGGEVAIRERGPALVGGPETLRTLIDVVEGRTDMAARDPRHGGLRNAVGPDASLMATLILDAEATTRLAEFLPALPLARVRALALGVQLGDPVQIRALVETDRLTGPIAEWMEQSARLLLPDAPIEVVISGAEVRARWAMPSATARQLFTNLLAYAGEEE